MAKIALFCRFIIDIFIFRKYTEKNTPFKHQNSEVDKWKIAV